LQDYILGMSKDRLLDLEWIGKDKEGNRLCSL
jgi:hypothetical protein